MDLHIGRGLFGAVVLLFSLEVGAAAHAGRDVPVTPRQDLSGLYVLALIAGAGGLTTLIVAPRLRAARAARQHHAPAHNVHRSGRFYLEPRPVIAPLNRPMRYVAIGDSSVEGLNDPDAQGRHRGWANRLADRLAAVYGDVLYANLAVRGRTTQQVRDEQLARAVAMKPDLAAVVTGTNDVLRRNFDPVAIEEEIYLMQRALIDAGATVITLTVPDLTTVMPLARIIRKRVFALDDAIRRACARSGAIACDLAKFSVSSDPRVLSPDRLHANSAGHKRITEGVACALGLPGATMQWAEPFPDPIRLTWFGTLRAELAWARMHLAPWVWRHLNGRSSGDGVTAKRPELTPVVCCEEASSTGRITLAAG